MFREYSFDEIDKETPAESEFTIGPKDVKKEKAQDPYKGTYANPASVKKWVRIIQYFLQEYLASNPFDDQSIYDLNEDLSDYVAQRIMEVYGLNIFRTYPHILEGLLSTEVSNFLMNNWTPLYPKDKDLLKFPPQPRYVPRYREEFKNPYRDYYRDYRYYEPTYDKIDEQKAIDWLLKYYNNTTFGVSLVVGLLKDYVFRYDRFEKDALSKFVKSLPEKYPDKLQLFGNKIHIGIASTDLNVDQLEPQPEINHEELKEIATAKIEDFKKYGEVTETENGIYIFIDNGANVLAVAHLDTVQNSGHYYTLQSDDEEEIIHNAQMDDRLGAYIIMYVLPRLGVKADILLTENEETGRSTAQHFISKKPYNWIFEFDRAGTDAVLYQYEDEETRKLLEEHGIHVGKGSYSDIADMDNLGVKAINFGTGAYESHNPKSHGVVSQIKHCITKFLKFYNATKDTKLPHKFEESRYYKRRKDKI